MEQIYGLQIAAYLFIILIGLLCLGFVWLYVQDKIQTKHTVRHNFPVFGRLRYVFEHWGMFFRQYFFSQDREEMPFNRAQRSWVYRAAKDLDNTVAFGSSRNLNVPGTIYFANGMFPALQADDVQDKAVTIGPGTEFPYTTERFFHISAMSFGAISIPAIKALTKGAAQAGIWLNTGEGGLSSYHLEGGCDVVYQIGTAKYGVRDLEGRLSDDKLAELGKMPAIKMFEIKLSQGAKPGKGGILPGAKVTEEISRMRGIPVGVDAISPNRFSEISTPDDLLDMIDRVRRVTHKPAGIKLCLGNPSELEALLVAIQKRGEQSAPDFMTIDSGDGGTGAAPMSLMDSVGMPIHESLPLVIDLLNRFGLRGRIKVIASGKLINPLDVAWALCAGADFINSARGFMLALGCIQALQCNRNTCPTGITTHNVRLQAGLDPADKAKRVANYAKNLEKEVATIAHSCG